MVRETPVLHLDDWSRGRLTSPKGGGRSGLRAAAFLVVTFLFLHGSALAQNLFVANSGNGTISEVTPAGAVSTFASGFKSPTFLAFDSSGNLYVTNRVSAGTVSKVTPAGVVSTFATGFTLPTGLAFDSAGNLYVENSNGSISKVTPAGVVSPFALGFAGPEAIAFDSSGYLYVANFINGSVTKVTPAGFPTFFATGFNSPVGLAFDASGNLYFSDEFANKIYIATPSGAVSIFTTAVPAPTALAFDGSGNLYVTGGLNGLVYKVTPAGMVSTFASAFNGPVGLAFANLAFAAQVTPDAYQLRYFANAGIGDQYIDISNSGASGASLGAGTTATVAGAICVNAYAFAADEQLMACCSCPVTPNGAGTLSLQNDLLNNVLEPQLSTSGVTVALTATPPVGGNCNGSAYAALTSLAAGLSAWGTALHSNTSLTTAVYQESEGSFEPKLLSTSEATRLTTLCSFIAANGSGPGICNSCKVGGQ